MKPLPRRHWICLLQSIAYALTNVFLSQHPMPIVTTMLGLTENLWIYHTSKISCIRCTWAKTAILIKLNSIELAIHVSIFYKQRRNRTMHLYFNSIKIIEKKQWKTINKLIGKTKALHCFSLVIDDNQLSTDQLAIPHHFNNHCAVTASIGVNNLSHSNKHQKDFFYPFTSQSIYLNPATPTENENNIREMKSKYSYKSHISFTVFSGFLWVYSYGCLTHFVLSCDASFAWRIWLTQLRDYFQSLWFV